MTLPGSPGNLTQDSGLRTSTAQPHKNLVIQDADIENRLVDTVGDGQDRMNGDGKMNREDSIDINIIDSSWEAAM